MHVCSVLLVIAVVVVVVEGDHDGMMQAVNFYKDEEGGWVGVCV